MTSTTATADTRLDALFAEASAWGCGDTEDRQVLDAIDAADAYGDRLALLQNSSLVPSRLCEALTALDPATYASAQSRAGQDVAFLALATVMVRVTGTSVTEAGARVEAATGEEIDPADPYPDDVRVSALTIEPGTVRLDQIGDLPVTGPSADPAPSAGASAALLPPSIRASLTESSPTAGPGRNGTSPIRTSPSGTRTATPGTSSLRCVGCAPTWTGRTSSRSSTATTASSFLARSLTERPLLMALTDHNDVFFGSTGDGWTFALLNRPVAAGPAILASAGFRAREHLGRTVYLLPPGTGGTAARTGDAIGQLLPHTLDVVELAWTAHQRPSLAGPPDAHITVDATTVTATVSGERAHAVLTGAGFTASDDGTLRLPDDLDDAEAIGRIVRAEAHLLIEGLQVRVDLGIATPGDLPPAPAPRA
ncbi:hypothetical protein OG800_50385 (plasmid) [Streptomyces sp. NBC_00445]|uniref:hypothetical protein n=1 Tax=Streptomyces sp. NBC_00445 TaxID=2975745 RepID=UPI002E1E28CE